MFPYEYSRLEGQGTPAFEVRHTEYPVLMGMLMWVSSKLTHWYDSASNAVIYLPRAQSDVVFFDIRALFASIFWLISVKCPAHDRRRLWDGVIAAASPLVIVQAFTNWDMLAVVFATTGMTRGREGARCWRSTRPRHGLEAHPVLLLIPCSRCACGRGGCAVVEGRRRGTCSPGSLSTRRSLSATRKAGLNSFA